MDNEKTIEEEIREYRAQFERHMASITAKQDRAEDEVAEIHAMQKRAEAEVAEIRAILRENSRQLKKTEAIVSKNAYKVSELNSNWGKFVESLVEGDLLRLLNERGIEVQGILPRSQMSYVRDDGMRKHKEFDLVAVNGEEVVVVEVKTTLRPDDVERFVEVMGDITKYFPDYSSKAVYGAMAYIRCDSDSNLDVEREGLYVIRATGDSANIVNAENFRPESFTNVASRQPRRHLRAVPTG